MYVGAFVEQSTNKMKEGLGWGYENTYTKPTNNTRRSERKKLVETRRQSSEMASVGLVLVFCMQQNEGYEYPYNYKTDQTM